MLTVKTDRADNVRSVDAQRLQDRVDGAVEGSGERATAEVGLDALNLGGFAAGRHGGSQGDEGERREDGELHFVYLVEGRLM